jgi:hypothetical protein
MPPSGKVIYAEWLKQTDPFNLYPFIHVLPSGDLFVGAYNRAFVLDISTFAVKRELPKMPGNVNRADAGRCYPLEGASFTFPQYAPYTEPLTFAVCGGSTPGAAQVSDNCISIQPDKANANWTIERMPSQRVMPNIVALPDGTFLICNGAHQGVAGFGLAKDPNFNAVLFDPRKPVSRRMTVLANTTIARLYHSEAILMDDGRVLISGSNPEDGVNPDEYRLETFTPPYLTNGATRPNFKIVNNKVDLTYGDIVVLIVGTSSGSYADIRVSLLAAVSSTHGNSFGMRTLFPAVSCHGASCSVTMPPNANIAPPGWYQMWVLDGPIPSTAIWVRVGGDPAGLGNWPKGLPDFDVPGMGKVAWSG